MDIHTGAMLETHRSALRRIVGLEVDKHELLEALTAMVRVRNLAAVERATALIDKHKVST